MTERAEILTAKDEIARQAADFFQRRRFWNWNGADQAELDAWLDKSALHRVAYLRLEGGIARLDSLKTQSPSSGNPKMTIAFRTYAFGMLAAASVALVATFGAPLVREMLQPPDRTFGTAIGGHAVLRFADGTEVELNTNTAMRYRMTTRERKIWLDRGEAYFRVAHNSANPFMVIAEGHRITDLGTEFLVRDDAGSVDVALVKGRAKLTASNSSTPVAMLTPGDEAVATPVSTIVTRKTPAQLADELAWQRGILVFRNTRLDEAVREFNRYNETKLVVADPSIAGLTFSAEIKTDHYEDFLQLAENVLNLKVTRSGNTIFISPGRPEKRKESRK